MGQFCTSLSHSPGSQTLVAYSMYASDDLDPAFSLYWSSGDGDFICTVAGPGGALLAFSGFHLDCCKLGRTLLFVGRNWTTRQACLCRILYHRYHRELYSLVLYNCIHHFSPHWYPNFPVQRVWLRTCRCLLLKLICNMLLEIHHVMNQILYWSYLWRPARQDRWSEDI